jgi:hypothetical protein
VHELARLRKIATAALAGTALAALAACSPGASARTPVVQIAKPSTAPRAGAKETAPVVAAGPGGAVERFDVAFGHAKKGCMYAISSESREFEASSHIRYCFDQTLHLRLVESDSSSEGVGSDAAYVFESDTLTCMRQSDRSEDPAAPSILYCVGAGGAALDENAPSESLRRITQEEYASLLSGARTATSEFNLPGPADAGGCSSFVEYETQQVGEETTYTPTSGIDVPSTLCDKTDELAASVANVRFPPQ